MSLHTLRFLAGALCCLGCQRSDAESPLFALVPPDVSGVTFANELPEDTAFNIFNYLYYYNGGGIAAGDVNSDGLPDLYFTSNLGSNRLYLNKGNYRFEDITDRAGVAGTDGWTSGVTMADVNGDGHLDIYVSGVSYLAMRGHNLLYLNKGDGTFTDATARFGLEHVGYSTQAAFFDYDADGDLDMYLLNASAHSERGPSARPQREPRHPRAGDRMFRNDGTRFVDVSERAGIYGGVEGYGLGVVASDLNLDGCIDLYVANDFQENDFLYFNNCDGTFTESIASGTGYTSRFSMGVDAADINNDGRSDIVVLDMFPAREDILKTAATAESFEVFDIKTRTGYHPQYARNTLQLNRGQGRFSEIGYLAGIFATDWSWAPLLADLDNDGRKDLFITNGIYRRPNDLDYLSFVSTPAVQGLLAKGIGSETMALLDRMPRVPLANYAFRNNGDLTFSNVAEAWGLAQPGFSNGAVYVDLDNSGSLDLVVNNINAPASIFRNRSRELNGNHYLRVMLRGAGGNTSGIGARVIVVHGSTRQTLEQMPTRGFQSAVDARLHFGLGRSTRVDTVTVIWPGGRWQTLTDVAVDTTVIVNHNDASGTYAFRATNRPSLFADVTGRSGVKFSHRENGFMDFAREPFMPHRLSTEGPALAIADVNGDGLDDIYVGGAKWQSGKLYIQENAAAGSGRFREGNDDAFRRDSLAEDVDAAFFDADADGDQDLYVVSGGNEFAGTADALRDRLYLNDGQGNFRRELEALPAFFESGSCVVPSDFNDDGYVDLFVGSRVVSRQYGLTPTSHLLENDGRGRFRDVTTIKAPALANAGMVSDAAWLDVDGDGLKDLVVAGEWMAVRVFRQENGRFEDRTEAAGLSATRGWWNSVTAADLNGDGRTDLVLGNLGLNSYIKASPGRPARLYVHDFGRTGTLKQILTFFKDGVSYPIAGRDAFVSHMPFLRVQFPSYSTFGDSRIDDIIPSRELESATVLEAETFATSVALNNGDGTFTLAPLPVEAQFAPVYATLVDDLDGDGHVDILLAGNFWGVTPVRGRYDASYGLLLRGDGHGTFTPVDMSDSNLSLDGQVRALETLRSADGMRIAVARNDDTLLFLRPLHQPKAERGPQ